MEEMDWLILLRWSFWGELWIQVKAAATEMSSEISVFKNVFDKVLCINSEILL